jgi:hypothetical protein
MISQENVNIQPVSLQYLYVKTANQQLAYKTTFSYTISDTPSRSLAVHQSSTQIRVSCKQQKQEAEA